MKKTSECKNDFLLKLVFSFILLLTIFLLTGVSNKVYATGEELHYLVESDICQLRRVQYDKIRFNEVNGGGKISVKIEGAYYQFDNGVWAHAASDVVFDVTKAGEYDYFTAYTGLNQTAASSSNGVIFKIYTSAEESGENWTQVTNLDSVVTKPGENATFVKINIKGVKRLRLEAGSNGSNGNDHSVYADAKLIKETYVEPGEDLVPSIEKLDKKIKEDFANSDLETNKEYELTLLKRELISRVGNYALKRFLSESEANKLAYTWLTSDVDTLRLYVMGGTPDGGSYYNSLTLLSRLYDEYSTDFTNTQAIDNEWCPEGMTRGDLYKKMAMALSLTHTQRVGLWMQSSVEVNQSDALRRYAIYKYMYENGMLNALGGSWDITKWFEALRVEEMRFVMYNNIDDEEILWLNRYVQDRLDQYKQTKYLTPHPYIAYVYPNYQRAEYYAEENKDYFNELFAIKDRSNTSESSEETRMIGIFDTEFNIPGGKNNPTYTLKVTRGTPDHRVYKVWMNFRNKFGTGAVCGGISKSGANIRGTHGIPAIVIGQPGHAAILYYTKNSSGQGYWGIDNDVSGWTKSEKGERMLLGWGNASYSRGYTVVYMVLAQEAINDFDNLVKCEEQIMRAKVYAGDLAKQEEIYRKALEIQPINIDAWYGLITTYNANESKTENDYYNLAEELAENLKCFPLPMYHLTNLIKPKLTSTENIYKFTLLQTRILTEGTDLATSTGKVLQPGVTRTEANYLLGTLDKTIATFSFDGNDAGKIVLSSRFDGNGIRWDYSLDGKQTWHEISFTAEEEHKLQLTPAQLRSIAAENDIYVHIVGVNYNEENLYKIDITEQSILENLYANDLENRVVGVNLATEWRYTENDAWTSYNVASPDLTGNKTVQVRQAATGTRLPSEASPVYTFTEDNQPETRRYIPVSNLSIFGVSTEAANKGWPASNAIDANLYTRWVTSWDGSDTNRYIILKLEKPIYLSAIEYVPTQPTITGTSGTIKSVVVSVSTNAENENEEPIWTEVYSADNWEANRDTKIIDLNESVLAQYIKIETPECYNSAFTGTNNYTSAVMFNLFQDLTKSPVPTAGVAYSTTESTNGNVVARLINPSTEITITNNNGSDTYVFTENGEFTFEFEDSSGKKGTALAKVDWIDKDGPTADVKYSLDANKKLLVLLDNISENVYLLDNNNNKINYVEVEKTGENTTRVKTISYLDNEGNVYKVVDMDENGNTSKISYKNTTNKVTNVETYITTLKTEEIDGNKVITIESEEYLDAEGNKITNLTEQEKEDLRVLQETTRSNPLEYALEESGEYEFRILDKSNNIAYKSIKVDYIENDTTILASDITYDITKLTNKSVTATINPYIINADGNKDANVKITSGHGETEYTFEENGTFTFTYKDADDKDDWEVKSHTASVNWIDKVTPNAEITYNITQETNGEVIATVSFDKENVIVTGGNTHTFTENGSYTFNFVDQAGNTGTALANVTWINKALPVATVKYSTTELTNKDVIATVSFDKENVTVTGGNTHTFTENGSYTFEYTTQEGSTGVVVANVDWIDKVAPIATITYSTTELTNKDVIATLSFNENNVSIVGGNGHRFTENGDFTFEFTDLAGNRGTIDAHVDWIDKTVPTAEIRYSTQESTKEPVVVTLVNESKEITITNNNGSREYTFTENGKFTFEFVDKAGNKGTVTATVNWIEKEEPDNPDNPDIPDGYLLGDVNKDGKITGTDLLAIKRHLVSKEKTEWVLTGDNFKAGDINQDGKITSTDLILIKRLVLKHMQEN